MAADGLSQPLLTPPSSFFFILFLFPQPHVLDSYGVAFTHLMTA